jgi:ribosomal protein S18 acetylase RimI-like enzyme
MGGIRDVRLRPAKAGDVPRITELVHAAYGPFAERLGRLPRPLTDDYAEVVARGHTSVAERGDQIVGLVVLGIDDEGFRVDNVAVDPAHHRTGVGRALLEHAEASARQAGFDSIYLYTADAATENLELYERIGYVEYDRRVYERVTLVYLRKALR